MYGQKEPVERGTSRAVELGHLRRREHAGHEHRMVHPGHDMSARIGVRNRLVTLAQPALHESDLIVLGDHDPLA